MDTQMQSEKRQVDLDGEYAVAQQVQREQRFLEWLDSEGIEYELRDGFPRKSVTVKFSERHIVETFMLPKNEAEAGWMRVNIVALRRCIGVPNARS